jgi:RNA recognition motif-containing protein
MSKKIYVGNISYSTTEDQLQQLFAQYGTVVNVNVIIDRQTNRSKGFGFVEMEEDDAARAAIDAINGNEVDGRNIKVSEANPPNKSRNNSFRY